MNKAFKVIWNHATQSWTAVSEIARSKGKTKSVKTAKTALAAAVAVAAATAGTSAHAAMAVGGDPTLSPTGSVAVGTQTSATSPKVSAGTASVTNQNRGMAIGENAQVSYATTNAGVIKDLAASMAIGNNASVADTIRGIAIGTNATVNSSPAVVIGTNATALQHTGVKDAPENNVVVIGNDALVRNAAPAQSKGATVIGGNALAGLLTDVNGATISLTNADYGTATGAATDTPTNPTIMTKGALNGARGVLYRAGITDASGTQISGVLLDSNEQTAIGLDARAIGDQSIAIGAQSIAGHNSVAIGGNDTWKVTQTAKNTYNQVTNEQLGGDYETTYAKDGSTAIGIKSYSNASLGTALGLQAKVNENATLGTAIGSGARVGTSTGTPTLAGVAIGAGSAAENNFTTAVGTGSKALAANATAVGAKAIADANNSLAYGATANSHAVNAVAIGTNATVTSTGVSSVAFGTDTNVSGERSVALGNNITKLSTAGSVVLGDSSVEVTGAGKDKGAPNAVETVKSVTIGSGAATLTYSGFAGQVKDAGQYLSIGSVDAERQIKNVAPGAITNVSTDAINGSQLYAALDVLSGQVGQIYFHTNNGSNAKTGDAVENIGNITEAAGAQGLYSTTAGVKSTATSQYGIAYGYNSTAVGGSNIDETKGGAISLGSNTIAYDGGIAMGINSQIQGQAKFGASGAIAIGRDTIVDVMAGNAPGVIAIGNATYAKGVAAFSEDANGVKKPVLVTAKNGETMPLGAATAVGDHAYANAGSVAFGQVATAEGQNATVLGTKALGSGHYTVAAGFEANATAESALALGRGANANNLRDTAIGALALANGGDSLAMGSSSRATGAYGIANGYFANAAGRQSIATGFQSGASGTRATAMGASAKALNTDAISIGSATNSTAVNSTAIGRATNAVATDSIAMGTHNLTPTDESIAIGTISATGVTRAEWDALYPLHLERLAQDAAWNDVNAKLAATNLTDAERAALQAERAAIGTARLAAHNAESAARNAMIAAATTEGEIVVGSHSVAKGNDSIIVGNDATVVGTQSTSVGYGHVIEANYSGAFGNPNYIRAGADRSYAFGNNNTITTADTFVLGSNVSRNADGTDNALGTVANSVYLGNGTEVTAGAAVGTKVLDTDQVAGATTTAGDTGTVADAKVGGLTYGGFAGDTAKGAVSVGAAGAERRVQNVAAGEISETSTDAINGSQLYAVYDKAAKPVTFTANTNLDTANTTIPEYTAGNGLERQLGDTLSIKGADTAIALTRNTDAATAGAYSARNIQTIVDDAGVQIQMSTNPVFNSTTIGGTFDQDGNQVGKPITIGTDAAGNNTISNLTTTLPVDTTKGTFDPTTATTTNAATLGDVLNAGWNLKTADKGDLDFVKPYDTVEFVNGAGTTIKSETDGAVSKIQVDVNLADTNIIGDITNNTNGTTSVGDNKDGDKLANISTVTDAINKSGWNVTSGATTGKVSGNTDELVNPGETVKFIAGKNIELTQDVNNFTFAVSDNPVFNSTTIGGTFDKDGNQVGSPIVISTTPDGKNVISNLNTTLPEPSTVNGGKSGTLPDNVTTTNAATLGDVLNAGWNLQENGTAVDFVKPYDTVNFKNGNGTTVVSSTDGNVSNIQYDVKVDNSTVKINSTTGAIEAVQPVTQVNGGNVTGPVNLVNGNTTTVTNTPAGIKVEVNTGNTTVGTDGKAALATDADANKVATVGDIINTINGVGWFTNSTNASGNTVGTATNRKISAGQAVNFEAGDNMQITQSFDANGNVTYTYATKQDVSFNSTNIGAAGNPITIGTVNGDNVISNLDDNLRPTSSTSDKPTTTSPISPAEAAKLAEEKGGNAATVNDVLNAGWNLETNGKPLDFVKPYDTVNFKDGNGTTIVSTTDGATSNIQVDVAVDNSTIKIVDGKLTAVTSKPSITDNQSGDKAGDINFNNTNTTTVNVDDKGNVTVDVNTGTSSATDTGLATPATDKDGNPLVKVVDPKTGDVTYTNAAGDVVDAADVIDNSDKVATVGDIVNTINNTGWQATSGAVGTGKVKGTTTEVVKPSELVTFQAGDNMVLEQEGQVFTYSVSPTPVFTNVTAKEGITLGDPNSTGPVVEMKPVTATTPVNATGSTNAPVNAVDMGGATFTNLAPNLPETVSTGNATTSTPEQKAPVVTDAQKSNAATLGDVLNAGWNLQNNGAAKDFVKPYDTVNFANGTGTVARVDTDGNVSNVYYDVAVDGTTTEITYTNAAGDKLYKLADGTYNTQKDGKGTTVAAGDITGSRVSAILPTTKVNGGDVTGPVNLVNGNTTTVTNTGNGIKVEVNTTPLTYDKDSGKVNTPAKPNAIATAGDVANAINNSGWKLAAEGTTGTELVNPSETVTFKAGDNMEVQRDGANITYATKKEVSFDKVTVGPVTINKDTGINAGNTKIAGVAAGTEDTDAVNVAQLKAAQTTVGSADQSVKVQETVSANGQRHYDLSVNLDSAVLKPINDRIDDLEDESRAGIAGTAAMINIPQVTRPGANLLGVGLGHHKGESALAVGFSSASDNERLIFKMTGSANTQGDFTIGTGMGWQW